MRLILDTNVLIDGSLPSGPDAEVAASSMSFAELAFGVAATPDPTRRLIRQTRLDRLRSELGPGIPFDDRAAIAFGRLCEIVLAAGRSPRSRSLDLMIAATAYVNDAGVLTHNVADFSDVRELLPIVQA